MKTERDKEILYAHLYGKTITELAKEHALSHARVWDIIKREKSRREQLLDS